MIPEAAWERLFNYQHAFDHPVTLWITVFIALADVASGLLIFGLLKSGREQFRDAWNRWKSWTWLAIVIILPILLGGFWTMLAVTALSLGCYREYARATGLFRHKTISAIVVLGILVLALATFDHFDRLFFATSPLTVGLIAIATIPMDQPKGYIQRVALGTFGFLMFGFSLGYLSYFANDANYRPMLLLLLMGVCLNDIFAYCAGRLLGHRKVLPQTSPGKTLGGCVGALILTTITVMIVGHFVFAGTAVDRWGVLLFLGVLISSLGQLGDLVLSSIKRDLGVKDIGKAIPGHGGLLDRFDSLVLVPPAVFHFLSLMLSPLGGDQPERILSSLWMIGS